VLVYLLNHGYAGQIIAWSEKHPQTRLHCFYDRPGVPEEFQASPALTFHRLDGEKFLKMMAECRHVVCTAGFESVGEAAWLGKPLFLVPVENHVEQQVNALDAQQFGIGIAEKSFNLDRLAELPDRLPVEKFRDWVSRAPEKLLAAIEQAVGEKNHAMSQDRVLSFPPGFLWGTATSPTQVEGHIENEWTPFTAADGGNCRIACDHYHRYPEDIGWMSRLGVNAYRFGIEWSRLQAAPFAPLNPAELARYVDVLDRLQAAGITPMVVLHHFSNPPWLTASAAGPMPPRFRPLWITSAGSSPR
jgi:hypothetical protein